MAAILLIDDDDHFRTSIRYILERQGHTVMEAQNGMQGLEMIQNCDAVDLLLVDVVMPGKGGLVTLKELRDTASEYKIIIMTGKIDPETDVLHDIVAVYGADRILYKPFRKGELLDAVDSVLENHGKDLP